MNSTLAISVKAMVNDVLTIIILNCQSPVECDVRQNIDHSSLLFTWNKK